MLAPILTALFLALIPSAPTTTPIVSQELARISHLASKQDLAAYLGHAHRIGLSPFFSFSMVADARHPEQTIPQIAQGGLGMRDPDFYLGNAPQDRQLRAAYQTRIAKALADAGESAAQAQAGAAATLALETALARVSVDERQLKDAAANYHYMPRVELKKLTPTLDWDAFFTAADAPAFAYVDIAQLDFMLGLNTILQHETMEQIRAYLRWQLLLAESRGELGAEVSPARGSSGYQPDPAIGR